MKITYAKFVNFKHLYSALGKYEVVLDFKDMTNIINVIIGKMGSGKTTILSHLQPWASFGTLDERNSDGIIIDGKNGAKEIVLVDGTDEYKVLHQWTWTKDHHSLKSYIQKNDVELNTNGNQSSFKEIIENELGVDQNFLRLSRLGPNVSNIIEMTSTERKDFIAERLSDVDMYLTIAKDMNERSRTITAQTQLLSKKLQNVTDDSIKNMKDQLRNLKRQYDSLNNHIESDLSEYHRIIGEIHVYLNGMNLDEYDKAMHSYKRSIDKLTIEIDELSERLQSVSSVYNSSAEILQRIGEIETLIRVKTSDLQALETAYHNYSDRKSEITKSMSAAVNNEYLKSLSETYANQVHLVECISDELVGFKCKYTSAEIKSIMTEAQIFDTLLGDILDYNRDSILECFNKSESESRSNVTKVIDSLRGKKFKLQKSLNNLEFLGRYDVSYELQTPSCGCHKMCPYYMTHPNTVMKSNINLTEKHTEILSQIDDIDSRIDKLSEYPIISKKLEHLRTQFIDISDKLDKLGVVRTKSLRVILSSSSNRLWYDNDQIINVLEKVTKKEQMYAIQLKLPELKAEIDKYATVNVAELSVELEKVNNEITNVKEFILNAETEISDNKKEIEKLHEMNEAIINAESIKSQISELTATRDQMNSNLESMCDNYDKAKSSQSVLADLSSRIDSNKKELKEVNTSFTQLNSRLDDIESTRAEFKTLVRHQELINIIKEAASSKKGIPLIYVRIFLNDCVGIINDLISMVFDDAIEIKDFKITDKEFFIPYYKNGVEISDVKTASQGERAIISLALSFALMRKGVAKYNILLLDEIDGALYSKDREKFLMILAQQIQAINAEQVFLITHNNCFDGYPINVIMTTPEHVDNNDVPTLYV